MPEIHVTIHWVAPFPDGTDLVEAEAMMKDPGYVADSMACQNALAVLHAKKGGKPAPGPMTATFGAVTHHK